ncbi:MAG: glycosyltransferase [Methanosphaera stadtmanae]|nr:glycosyltransferase [Methanosphaera stadtmanae]
MNKYKVSLITPCYNIENINNNEKTFFNSLNSVIKQSIGYENIEHILVDDCSTDNTYEILKELSLKYPNIKLISLKDNSGSPSYPRNIGIKNASSDYIMFLDQDDIFEENMIETLYNKISSENVEIVKSNNYIILENKIYKNISNKKREQKLNPHDSNLFDLQPFIWTTIFEKQFILNNNINFPKLFAEDVYFLVKCSLNIQKGIIILNDYYGYYYLSDNNNSLSHSFNKKQAIEYKKVFEYCLEKLISSKQHEKYIQDFYSYSLQILMDVFLRSHSAKKEKIEIIQIIQEFMTKFNSIPYKLPIFWNLICILVHKNYCHILLFLNRFILFVFDQKWFVKLFRNKNYEETNIKYNY